MSFSGPAPRKLPKATSLNSASSLTVDLAVDGKIDIVFVLIEYVRRGKRIAPQKEAMVHLVGLVAMLLFAVIITYFDILRIIAGDGIIR